MVAVTAGALMAIAGRGPSDSGGLPPIAQQSRSGMPSVSTSSADASSDPTGSPSGPTTSPGSSGPAPGPSSTPAPPGAGGTVIPVRGSGRDVGTQIVMAPGLDGSLYVAMAGPRGPVIALLGRDGRPRPGWPLRLHGVADCDLVLPVLDLGEPTSGSVRVVCTVLSTDDGLDGTKRRAFAFGPDGRTLPSWPVDLGDAFSGRAIGDDLTMLERPYLGDTPNTELVHLLTVQSDGTIHRGADVTVVCCDGGGTVGPDGIAYLSNHHDWSADPGLVKTDILGFDEGGIRDGWPVVVDGNASDIAFDPRGSVHLVVGSPIAAPARTLVLSDGDQVGQSASVELPIVSTSNWDGAGADFPGPPIVAFDGTSFIVSTTGGATEVMAVDPGGDPLPGWPYRSSSGIQWTGFCGNGDVGCGRFRSAPVAGPDNVLYLLQAAVGSSAGGRIVAVGPDGRVREGWPVGLKRPGSMFWSVVADPEGGVWALAIEPESHDYSASILSIADDSTVRWTTTIAEP